MLTPAKSITNLNRIYLEVTNRCNLDCRICIRNTWDDLPGSLSLELYHKLIDDIRLLDPVPEIFFGGYGEPLSHPDLITMIAEAGQQGIKTSLITNGTLLSREMSADLIHSGLDHLWVSLDGVHSESYQDVQLGKYLPTILANLEGFQKINNDKDPGSQRRSGTDLGLAFVIMKNNAGEISEIFDFGRKIGISSFFLTYLEAYSGEMAREICYPAGISRSDWVAGDPTPGSANQIDPQEVLTDLTEKYLFQENGIQITGSLITRDQPLCPFVERGAAVVRWDGEVSPCLPLMYSHVSILGNWKRQVQCHSFGNIRPGTILDLWNSPEYRELRQRLLDNSFSPCLSCRDCWLSDDNLLDCMGYEKPTCGGCLWAHGLIQCP